MTKDEIVGTLREEARKRKQVNNVISAVITIAVVLSVLSIGMELARGQKPDWTSSLYLLCFVGVAAGATPAVRAATRAAKEIADPGLIPELVDCLEITEADVRTLVHESIVAAAQNISPETDSPLTAAQTMKLAEEVANLDASHEFVVTALSLLKRNPSPQVLATLDPAAQAASASRNSQQRGLESAIRMATGDMRIALAKARMSETIESETVNS